MESPTIHLESLSAALLSFALCLSLTAPTTAEGKQHRSEKAKRDFKAHNPCPSTGKPRGACPGYVIDHVVPLCAGGKDARGNMQWQNVRDAELKDSALDTLAGVTQELVDAKDRLATLNPVQGAFLSLERAKSIAPTIINYKLRFWFGDKVPFFSEPLSHLTTHLPKPRA